MAKTREEKLQVQREYQRSHRELYRAACKRSREKLKASDPEKWAAQLASANVNRSVWAKTDVGRAFVRLQRQRRRARLKHLNSPGMDRQLWETICKQATNDRGEICCKYCKNPCKPTIDHVVPISRGGKDEASNVVVACSSCNSSKCDHLIHEWPRAPEFFTPEHLAAFAAAYKRAGLT